MKTTTAHKILIVDDNPDDIEITKIILRRMGHALKVEEAPSGEAALTRLRDGKDLPSMILLDIKMPGMNGIETLRLIRANERLKNIYVIVLTNSSLESDREAAFEGGTDRFLHKSLNMERFGDDLKSILERWLEG